MTNSIKTYKGIDAETPNNILHDGTCCDLLCGRQLKV